MNEIQQQRHDALTAHPLEAAERAVAHQLNTLAEGATPEFAAAADLLGCRAPGETAATGTSKRADGHIDTWRRALPKLADDKIIRFTTPVELVQGGRQHGWLAAGTRDPLPDWAWNDELVNKAVSGQWAQRFDFSERVMADERVGYTAGADAVMLAAHADSSGTLYARTMVELRELTGRSRNAVERSLEILERAGYATVVRDERVRPMLHTISLHLRGNQAAAPSPAPAETEVVAPAPAPKEEVWDFTAPPAAPAETAPAEDEPVIEIAPQKVRLRFPEYPKRFIRDCQSELGRRFDPEIVREIAVAAARFEALCGYEDRFVDELWRDAYIGLAKRLGRESIFTSAAASLPYIEGILAKKNYLDRAAPNAKTREERIAVVRANRANADAKAILKRIRELMPYGDERDDREEAERLLHNRLLPLAVDLAPVCDNDPAFAEALLRLAFKEGRGWVRFENPDPGVGDYLHDWDPGWSWPEEMPTWSQREERAHELKSLRTAFEGTEWYDRNQIRALDDDELRYLAGKPHKIEWLRSAEGTAAIRAGLEISPYDAYPDKWDALFAAAGIDKRAFVQEAA